MIRILYVEDNQANVFLVKRVARMGNHEVITLADGAEVLAQFDKLKPDLVLMDVQIEGELDGLEVVRRLRQQGHTTPIVAVTAYAMVGDEERCLEAGCDSYMPKPLPIPRLVELFAHYDKSKNASTSEVVALVKERLGIRDENEEASTPTQQEENDT
ncbi:MAG: response regulator [Anaerolineae bacterium]|nr:response regulator [Anaerolineae bacterium]MDW8173773.1 response regulator [Anaerolineae bacterium]